MAQGVKALRKLQIGAEASQGGTTDPATTIWRGMGVLADNRETVFAEEQVGILGGTTRTYVSKAGGEIQLEGDATFEQLPYAFQGGVYNTTPTTDSGSGYIWTWTVASVSTDNIASSDLQTYVIEGGDNNEAEVMRFSFVRELGVSGNVSEALQNTITMEGREIAGSHTYTASLSIPTVETILFSKGKLYIDPTSDTIGTTQVSNTLMAVDLSFMTGWQPVFSADGRLDFAFIKRVDDEITLNVTFEHNATATTEKAAWRAQTERALRVKFEGNALTSAGAYTYKTFTIDLWGKWESFDSLSDQDGNDVVSGMFRARYSATGANKARFVIVNELSALP